MCLRSLIFEAGGKRLLSASSLASPGSDSLMSFLLATIPCPYVVDLMILRDRK